MQRGLVRIGGRFGKAITVAVLAAALVAACSAGASASPSISGAWVRPSTGMDMPTAAYLTIVNSGGADDTLVRVSSPVASSVQMHETSTDASGMTGMAPVTKIDIKAGATVTLAPGGMHLMLMGLTKPIQTGDKIELDLVFEHAGTIVVQAVARTA